MKEAADQYASFWSGTYAPYRAPAEEYLAPRRRLWDCRHAPDCSSTAVPAETDRLALCNKKRAAASRMLEKE